MLHTGIGQAGGESGISARRIPFAGIPWEGPEFPRRRAASQERKNALMINGKRIAVVMPAYNAEKTLEQTVRDMPEAVDIKILVDDSSSDQTVPMAKRLGLTTFVHDRNYGYGRNQQTDRKSVV